MEPGAGEHPVGSLQWAVWRVCATTAGTPAEAIPALLRDTGLHPTLCPCHPERKGLTIPQALLTRTPTSRPPGEPGSPPPRPPGESGALTAPGQRPRLQGGSVRRSAISAGANGDEAAPSPPGRKPEPGMCPGRHLAALRPAPTGPAGGQTQTRPECNRFWSQRPRLLLGSPCTSGGRPSSLRPSA